jgi:acetolactate decarboxylase
MGLDPALVAAATVHRHRMAGTECTLDDAVHQVSLAHVLLDGGYDGVTTLAEALRDGDHGLGTVDRLDGELVVVDGEPWRVDWRGTAEIMAPETLTPFAVVAHLRHPRRVRVTDTDRDGVAAMVEQLVHDPAAVVAVRLEGRFHSVLVRSVAPQEPPYLPYADVCARDEVRWEHRPFEGVFVGFRFPELRSGAAIPGLHLHGLDLARTTGGHNYELVVDDAELSVGATHELMLSLPDSAIVELLETGTEVRAAQRALLHHGSSTPEELANHLAVSHAVAREHLEWLADRGLAELRAEPTGERWHCNLRSAPRGLSRVLDTLDEYDDA